MLSRFTGWDDEELIEYCEGCLVRKSERRGLAGEPPRAMDPVEELGVIDRAGCRLKDNGRVFAVKSTFWFAGDFGRLVGKGVLDIARQTANLCLNGL